MAECRAKCHTLYFYRNIQPASNPHIEIALYVLHRGKNEGSVYSANKSEDARLTSVRIWILFASQTCVIFHSRSFVN